MSIDIDDLFGDLDEIEQSIEDLNAESDLDRHDRLKTAYLDAEAVFTDAQSGLENVLSKHAPLVGIGADKYRADDHFCHRAFDWGSSDVDYWNAKDRVITRAQKDNLPSFKPEITDDAQAEIVDAIERYISTESLKQAARAAWQAAVPNFGEGESTDEDEDITFLTEGCYIEFTDRSKDRWGDPGTAYHGFGEVIQITAANYIVKVDHDEIVRRGGYRDRDHFRGKDTARLVISKCFGEAGYDDGGRSVKFLWGPTGNGKRAEMAAVEAAKKAKEQKRQDDAVALRDAAQAEYNEAVEADRQHQMALRTAETDAEAAALDILKAKYAKELAALTKAMKKGIEEGLAEYERPAILDNRPSNRWQDYLTKEEQA